MWAADRSRSASHGAVRVPHTLFVHVTALDGVARHGQQLHMRHRIPVHAPALLAGQVGQSSK
jgi:hypothetical protein